jgi:hypothetical protein
MIRTFYPTSVRTLNPYRIDRDARIQAAIIDLESQTCINFAATTRKWGIERNTLAKRYRGETGPNRDANSYSRQLLSDIYYYYYSYSVLSKVCGTPTFPIV